MKPSLTSDISLAQSNPLKHCFMEIPTLNRFFNWKKMLLTFRKALFRSSHDPLPYPRANVIVRINVQSHGKLQARGKLPFMSQSNGNRRESWSRKENLGPRRRIITYCYIKWTFLWMLLQNANITSVHLWFSDFDFYYRKESFPCKLSTQDLNET